MSHTDEDLGLEREESLSTGCPTGILGQGFAVLEGLRTAESLFHKQLNN